MAYLSLLLSFFLFHASAHGTVEMEPRAFFEEIGRAVDPQHEGRIEREFGRISHRLDDATAAFLQKGREIESLWESGSADAQLGILLYLVALSAKNSDRLSWPDVWENKITQKMRKEGFPAALSEKLVQSAKYAKIWGIIGGTSAAIFTGLMSTVFYVFGIDSITSALFFVSPCFDVGAACMLPMVTDAPLKDGETMFSRVGPAIAAYIGYIGVKYTSLLFSAVSVPKFFKWFFRSREMTQLTQTGTAPANSWCPLAILYHETLGQHPLE